MAKHPNPISSHVLDTASGLPAPGIGITFEKFDEVKKCDNIRKKYINNGTDA